MFLPENIDLAHSEKYSLSIRLTPNGFSFCISDRHNTSVLEYQETTFGDQFSYLEHIQKLVFDIGFFTQPFYETNIIMVTPHYTYIPDAFFDKKRAADVFRFNVHEEVSHILTDISQSQQAHVIYNVDDRLHSFLSRNIWNPQFKHFTPILIDKLLPFKSNDFSKRCLVCFHDSYFTIVAFNQETLQTALTFNYTNNNDAIYYISSTFEKLGFNQLTDLLAFGNIKPQHQPIQEVFAKLVQHIEVIDLQTVSSKVTTKNIPLDLALLV